MSDTQTTNSFVSQLEANAEKFKDPEAVEVYLTQVRENAAEHFLKQLLTSEEARANMEQLITHRTIIKQKTALVHRWQGRGDTYMEQSLSDLLDLGDLLQRMQDFLDSTYGSGRFRIFNHQIRRTRDTALTISWTPEGFQNLDDIILRNRARAQERLERLKQRRGGDDADEGEGDEDVSFRPREDRGPPRARYEDRGPPRARYEERGPPRARYEERGPPRARPYQSNADGPRRGGGGDRGGGGGDRGDRGGRGGGDRSGDRSGDRGRSERPQRPQNQDGAPSARRQAVASYDRPERSVAEAEY
jgi:hypothetical protein